MFKYFDDKKNFHSSGICPGKRKTASTKTVKKDLFVFSFVIYVSKIQIDADR